MRTPEPHQSTDTKLKRIAWLSSRDAGKRFDCLMHLFNVQSLAACFHELDGRKAVGVDGISKSDYGKHLDANLENLIERMKRLAYCPGPVRQVLIPRDDGRGGVRSLGISNFEDKIVQSMVRKVLESIYEPLFLDCSFGFRPGKSCHDTVTALHQHLYHNDVEMVIDLDLSKFFDGIDNDLLVALIGQKIHDATFLRYLRRMLRSGVLGEGELRVTDEGVPQGSPCSPILSNIFAHYVIDEWFEDTVKRHCEGRVTLFRYADDLVICCQCTHDAHRVRKALERRLDKYKLAVNERKTRLVTFRRPIKDSDCSEVFDFLGFTFYWGKSRSGRSIPKVKTSGERLRAKLKNVNAWGRAMRNRLPLPELWKLFCAKLRGHIQYFGVSFNIRAVRTFLHRAVRILYKWLNRRSQRRSFNWEQFKLFVLRCPVPKVRVVHSLF